MCSVRHGTNVAFSYRILEPICSGAVLRKVVAAYSGKTCEFKGYVSVRPLQTPCAAANTVLGACEEPMVLQMGAFLL